MITYKATNGINTYLSNFNNLQDAETAFAVLGPGYTISIAPQLEQIIKPAITLQDRMQKGYEIYIEYLKDNDAIAAQSGQPMSVLIVEVLAMQMAPLKLLLESGSLIQVKEKLLTTTPDNILTQDRIDKYIGMINNFLGL